MSSNRLQELESPGASDGLRAVLYAKFAAEVIDVPLDIVQAHNEAASDLTIGSSCMHQAQHLMLALISGRQAGWG